MRDVYAPIKTEESELGFIRRWLKERCDNNEIDKIPNMDALIRTPNDALRILRGVCEDKGLCARFSKQEALIMRENTPPRKKAWTQLFKCQFLRV